jgi:hypothetical protein
LGKEKMIPLHPALTKEGLDVADLARIYEDCAGAHEFLPAVIAEIRLEDAVTRPRTSWLLLRHSADHSNVPEKILRAAIEMVANSPLWEARLHLCQLFARSDCPAALAEPLFEFLSDCAADKRAFLRAWALTALHRLQRVSPDDRREIERLLRRAQSDPAKAVQARIRQIKKPNQTLQPTRSARG